jgi:hypothetical protein
MKIWITFKILPQNTACRPNRRHYHTYWKPQKVICYNKNQRDALFILYLFRQSPLHVSGMLLPIIRRYHCIYITIGTCYTFQLTVWWPAGHLTANYNV